MFGRKKEPTTAVLDSPPSPVIDFPEGKIPHSVANKDTQLAYKDLSDKLGFKPPEFIYEQLIEFCELESIKIYDYDQVNKWLGKKKKEEKQKYWCWRPLRDKDICNKTVWGLVDWGYSDGYYDYESNACRPYERLVPIQALNKVLKIENRFGDDVKFFVSDYSSDNPDPFIMVRPSKRWRGNIERITVIFDVWDEPGFGE
jgi:hypothetical protein